MNDTTTLPNQAEASTAPGAPSTGRFPAWAACLLVLALWLLVRPYRGIRHDAILYVGQVLSHLHPSTVGQDLFFQFGSQDRYSIFSALMTPLASAVGVSHAFFGVLVLAELAFATACWFLVRDLPTRTLRWAAMVALAVVPHTYGGAGALSYAEAFLTARSLAEPFALAALACLMHERRVAAFAFLGLALVCHPLITLPAAAVGWVWLALRDRRWWWAAAVLVPAAVAGRFGVAPFDALWQRFDPEWLGAMRNANRMTFLASQDVLDWSVTAFDLGVIWMSRRVLSPSPLLRMAGIAAACCLVAMPIWGIGADLMHNVLLTQLQVWRSEWLLHLFAVLLLPALLMSLAARGALGRWQAATLLLAAVAVNGNLATGWLCLIWAAGSVAAGRRQHAISDNMVRIATWASLLAAVIVTAVIGGTTWTAVAGSPERFHGASPALVAAGLSLVAGGLGALLLAGLVQPRAALRHASVAVILLGVAWGVSVHDQRSEWQQFMEASDSTPTAQRPFAARFKPDSRVLWTEGLLPTWLVLDRPDELSDYQAGGLLFHRDTAIEFQRRLRQVVPLSSQRDICRQVALTLAGLDPEHHGHDSLEQECMTPIELIVDYCRTPHAADFVILEQDDPKAHDHWSFRPDDPLLRKTLSLYDCARLR